jgi:DNA-binding FrmR family transcriptional regulator
MIPTNMAGELHKTRPDIVKRLKRAEGHLRSIVAMLEEGRPCLDITQQLHAVEKAVAQAKKILVHDHIDHCLEHAVGTNARDGRRAVEEFKAISKYL